MISRALLVLVTAFATLPACSDPAAVRYTRKQAQKSLTRLEAPGLVIGEFKVTKVTDGDTIRVDGLDASLRLLGFDAEETFKHENERRDFDEGWESYKVKMRNGAPRPVKFATPLGMAAWEYAKQWFDGVEMVRLERDHPSEIRDAYNRYLAYVFAQKNGKWLCYNIEAVRAGMAPYFPKYGNSRRFHQEFLDAEAEAKAAKRGIWADGVMSYPDYPEREAWWQARGDFVAAFRKDGEGKPNYIDISHWDALSELEAQVGKEVVLLGVVDNVTIGERGPTRVTLSRSRGGGGFPLIFFDKDVFGTSGIAKWRGEYVTVTGTPTFYENKHNHKKQLQIVIDRASQIRLSPVPGLQIPTVPGTP
jgi:endonuclease YncB( thermonuclease family)